MTRKYLTPKERRTMHEKQGRCCYLCGEQISIGSCIAEHWATVALGNEGKPDCLLCIPCANRKTNGTAATSYGSDKHAIAKAKRLERIRLEGRKPTRHPMQSRGFGKSLRKKMSGEVVRVDE